MSRPQVEVRLSRIVLASVPLLPPNAREASERCRSAIQIAGETICLEIARS